MSGEYFFIRSGALEMILGAISRFIVNIIDLRKYRQSHQSCWRAMTSGRRRLRGIVFEMPSVPVMKVDHSRLIIALIV